jgi:phage tail sheath gpL-like
MDTDKCDLKVRHVVFLLALAVIVAWALFHGEIVKRVSAEGTANQFYPHVVGQSAWFQTLGSAITTEVIEANATPFLSETGMIQIAVIVNSGSATGGTITVYTKVSSTDTVYVAIPSATYTLTASASKVSDKITVGPGYHKLVVTTPTGTFNITLKVRDF